MIRAGGVVIVDDAYNASPGSMRAALELLAGLPATRRIGVLGEMRELGAFMKSRGIIEDDEAFHPTTRNDEVGVICWAWRGCGIVVTRDRTTKHDACLEPQTGKNLVQNYAADIVEEHIDPVGTEGGKLRADVFRVIINDAVKSQFVLEPVAFGFAASGTDHSAALDLGNLSRNRARGAGRSRNDKSLSSFGLTDVEHAEVGSWASYPEQTESKVRCHTRRQFPHREKARTVGRDIVLPTEGALNELARFVVWML